MCHWPLKGSRKAKKSERGANGRGPLPRRRLFFRRFFRGGDASKKARCSESQRRKIGRPRPHWRSGSVLTPPLEEQPGKTELSLSLALSHSFPLSSLTFSFSLASTPLSSPLPLRRPPAASTTVLPRPSNPRFLSFFLSLFFHLHFLASLSFSPSSRSAAILRVPSFSPSLSPSLPPSAYSQPRLPFVPFSSTTPPRFVSSVSFLFHTRSPPPLPLRLRRRRTYVATTDHGIEARKNEEDEEEEARDDYDDDDASSRY